jgi:ATP-dependent Clp protease ATP-binding subunit ClpA
MIADQESELCLAFCDQAIDFSILQQLLDQLLGSGTKHNDDALPMTPSLQIIVELAWRMPRDEQKIQDLHLLLALLIDEENAACGALEELEFNLKQAVEYVKKQLKLDKMGAANSADSSNPKASAHIGDQMTE